MPVHKPVYFLETSKTREHVLDFSTKDFEIVYPGIRRVTNEAEILIVVEKQNLGTLNSVYALMMKASEDYLTT